MAGILKSARDSAVVDALELAARERARVVLAEAEGQAASVRAEAAREREVALQNATRAGREEGLASAAAALLSVAEARQRRLEAAEGEIAAVALQVARKLVGRAVCEHPELVAELTRQALEPVRSRREVLVRVNPRDAPLLRAEQPRLRELLDRAPGIAVREDAAIDPGGVVVETEAGRVDARVEAQLAVLERALAEGIR
jgi:flagellar biosynthesis/type III secretory pathway protein FliH